ncbi:MAG TPA: DUF2853 family protein [Saprospiraceae bacterium]|nr:DUF2853 family protein [Saprospiraceae bacterium]HND89959.1 DUF2853 family protein [Saprospiraceae bacterium]HNG90968.1 DUF2853 family protein [Saprospiraceae bacterium]
MATFVETFDNYKSEMNGLGISYDEALFSAVTKALGPVIYNNDSSRVSCSDADEMNRVKTNFLIGKLGLADGPALDAALKEVCDQLGSSNRNKYRAMFYYLLVVKFGKQGLYK